VSPRRDRQRISNLKIDEHIPCHVSRVYLLILWNCYWIFMKVAKRRRSICTTCVFRQYWYNLQQFPHISRPVQCHTKPRRSSLCLCYQWLSLFVLQWHGEITNNSGKSFTVHHIRYCTDQDYGGTSNHATFQTSEWITHQKAMGAKGELSWKGTHFLIDNLTPY